MRYDIAERLTVDKVNPFGTLDISESSLAVELRLIKTWGLD